MGILAWCIVGLVAGALAQRAVGAPKRGCHGTIAIGAPGALFAGLISRLATGDPIDTFDELDLGSIFVAFIGAAALLLVLEAASGTGRRRRR
ncbi:MAG: GlsB/YeaQ/YmgE family stress response membrane protein [Actinomycetota bacterium]